MLQQMINPYKELDQSLHVQLYAEYLTGIFQQSIGFVLHLSISILIYVIDKPMIAVSF